MKTTTKKTSLKMIIVFSAAGLLIVAMGSSAMAVISNFDTFSLGSINGQGGWTVADSWGNTMYSGGWGPNLDEGIVDDGTGNKVWRISNAYAYGAFSSQPFSPTSEQVAGESGSSLWNDYGPDNTNPYSPPHYGANATTNLFHSSFDFRSATGAAQPGLSIVVSDSAKQSTVRQTYLKIYDNGVNGFNLTFLDQNVGYHTDFVTGLSYNQYHNITMDTIFVGGVVDVSGNPYTLQPGDPGFNPNDVYGNDIVNVYVDGDLKLTASTWEAYYYGYDDAHPAPTLQAVNSLLFRVAGTAAPDTLGNGFYFDNVEVSNVPEPGTLALLGLAGLCGLAMAWIRRRQSSG